MKFDDHETAGKIAAAWNQDEPGAKDVYFDRVVRSVSRAAVGQVVDGWRQVGIACPAGRRALWLRLTDDALELCAGREGDDAYVVVTKSNPAYRALRDVMESAVWAAEGAE